MRVKARPCGPWPRLPPTILRNYRHPASAGRGIVPCRYRRTKLARNHHGRRPNLPLDESGRSAARPHRRSHPREFSPCGTCLDRTSPQLFAYPERYFYYLSSANVPFVEALIVPLVEKEPLGTIWIVSHNPAIKFDAEDVRIMTESGGVHQFRPGNHPALEG